MKIKAMLKLLHAIQCIVFTMIIIYDKAYDGQKKYMHRIIWHKEVDLKCL